MTGIALTILKVIATLVWLTCWPLALLAAAGYWYMSPPMPLWGTTE